MSCGVPTLFTLLHPEKKRYSVKPGTTAHLGPRRVVGVLNRLAAAKPPMTRSEIHGPRAEINSYAVSNNMGMMPCPSCTKVLSSKTKKVMIHLGANPVSARQRLDRLDSKNPDWRTKHGTGLVFSSLRIKSTENFPGLNQILMHSAHCAP